jgi:hypothetical protein
MLISARFINKHGRHMQFSFLIGRFRKIFSSASAWPNKSIAIVHFVYFMVFNAAFNNISVISWLSVLLVEKTGELGENHRLVASH